MFVCVLFKSRREYDESVEGERIMVCKRADRWQRRCRGQDMMRWWKIYRPLLNSNVNLVVDIFELVDRISIVSTSRLYLSHLSSHD